jgi:1,4-alpha-glucan branching enzyme
VSLFSIYPVDPNDIAAILHGSHSDPFRVLGPHRAGNDLVIRVFRPEAKTISVVAAEDHDRIFPAERLHVEGLYQSTVPNESRDFSYLLKVTAFDGSEQLVRDSYSYEPMMGEIDLHLFAEGNHKRLYDKFGAHPREIAGERGVYFAVWAPNAARVSVVGDFNFWDGRVHSMRKLMPSGVWEITKLKRSGANWSLRAIPSVFSVSTANRLRRWFSISSVTSGAMSNGWRIGQRKTGIVVQLAFTKCISVPGAG